MSQNKKRHLDRIPTKDALTSHTRREINQLHSFPLELGEKRSEEASIVVKFWSIPRSRHVSPCQNLPRQTTKPASRAFSRGVIQQFLCSLVLLRIPPPRGLLYSKHSPEHHSAVPEITSYEDCTATLRSILEINSSHSEQGNYINWPHWSSPSTQQEIFL